MTVQELIDILNTVEQKETILLIHSGNKFTTVEKIVDSSDTRGYVFITDGEDFER